MKTYHVVESKFMDVLFQHGLKKKEWFLALRAVTLKPLSFFLENMKIFASHPPDYGLDMNSKDVYTAEDFSSLYNLVGHHDLWEWRDHAYKAFFALFFLRCLQKSEYFGDAQSKGCELGEISIKLRLNLEPDIGFSSQMRIINLISKIHNMRIHSAKYCLQVLKS